ncbi:Hsp20/alpha crystallin family protein [Tunicatimonas pelagia]|uniref:Hsp20/alpha crystallin family protein n=1 Tax=Tunicatimonas pelagia TaxID=931531 RepID=UPI002666F033|nr:Hsp20/alpha crystallin family protein [Tunicatimonas pelagia]WKN43937.1 Hsp20/alpha crystallin family protein [Tunicatimonas pelagia]
MSLIRRTDFPNFPSLLDNFFGRDMDMGSLMERGSMPAVNIRESEDKYAIEVAAPGLKKDSFNLHLDHNVLSISSETEHHNDEKDAQGNYTRREFSYQSFRRSFTLPDAADAEKIEAKYNEGILHISIPKREEMKQRPPRTINIS